MAVNSAQELHDLITTLSNQFQNIHHPATGNLWNQANQHIHHVEAEAGTWITNEIQTIINEWQAHLNALKQLEDWFGHHAPNLNRIAADAARLAQESFS
jgi:hypothetical protein